MHEPVETFENRLRKALDYRNMKPIELKLINLKLQQTSESQYFRHLNVSNVHFTYLKSSKMVGRK